MPVRSVNSAMAILVAGNFLAILSDVVIKWQAGDVALFQFVLVRLLFTLVLLLPFLALVDRSQLFRGSRIHLVRAHVGLFGIICMVIALASLPLATANALFYAAPVLVMVLGMGFFGEPARLRTMVPVVAGFVGILVIVRPDELGWASLSALGLALALAVNALLVRKLPTGQSTVHTLLLTHVFMLPVALILAIREGAGFDSGLLLPAAGSAVFILGYNVSVIVAYRRVEAGQVTSAEYTGLIWAIVLGWLWFSEIPDPWFYVGSALIVVPMLVQAAFGSRRQPGLVDGGFPAGKG